MNDAIHPAPIEFSADQLAADPILRYFHYSHLPAVLQRASRPFCVIADFIVAELPRNPERTVALRKLLEAKDAAVRANVPPAEPETFETRLVAEYSQMVERTTKLRDFMGGHGYARLLDQHRHLLNVQENIMSHYIEVLRHRLQALNIPVPGLDDQKFRQASEDARLARERRAAGFGIDGATQYKVVDDAEEFRSTATRDEIAREVDRVLGEEPKIVGPDTSESPPDFKG